MLYTDCDFVTEADLVALDSEVPGIKKVEGITLDGEGGIVTSAIADAGQELLASMKSFGMTGHLGVSSGHMAAVHNTGTDYTGPRIRLGQVVVHNLTPGYPSAVKSWVTRKALSAFYQDAFSRQVEDRYSAKMALWEGRAKAAWRALTAQGLPVIQTPLPCPGALHEPESGTWDEENLLLVAGGSESPTQVQVAITWVGAAYVSQSNRGNAESARSKILSFTIEADKLLKIDISSLIPPTGSYKVGTSQGVWYNMAATGWNVWVGAEGSKKLYLQNESEIPVDTKEYTLSGAPVLSGAILGEGQYPDRNVAFVSHLGRA